jgi:hypothetical protein
VQITVTNRLHEAIHRFKGNTGLWIKDKAGIELEPQQLVFVEEIKNNNFSVIIEPPRAGKTVAVEAVCMEELATNEREHELIIGPALSQSKNALKEQLDWIEGSPILKPYIAKARGKPLISDSRYEFLNKSGAQALSIGGRIDSYEASILRGEEMDDMDMEVWNNRVISRGGRKNKSGLPLRIRLSGTIQLGNGPLFMFSNDKNYHLVTQFDIYTLLQLGIYDEGAIQEAKNRYTKEQWLRIYLLIFIDAKNFIWESSLHKCLMKSLSIGWKGIEYNPYGPKYKPTGMVYCGFDCGHSGEGKIHSVYRADLVEVIGNQILWLNGFEWESTEDPDKIEKELCDYWGFYGASAGYGDALKSAMIARMNDRLFNMGYIDINRGENPENKPSDWDQWSFSPKWNTGKAKYIWGSITKILIDNTEFIIPYYDRKDDRPIALMAKRLTDALTNIRQVHNKTSYDSLEIIKPEIGDDPFDSINMAIGCANDRAVLQVNIRDVKLSDKQAEMAGIVESVIPGLHNIGKENTFTDFEIYN